MLRTQLFPQSMRFGDRKFKSDSCRKAKKDILCNKTIPIITTNTTRRYQMKNLLQRTNITGKFTNLKLHPGAGLPMDPGRFSRQRKVPHSRVLSWITKFRKRWPLIYQRIANLLDYGNFEVKINCLCSYTMCKNQLLRVPTCLICGDSPW